MRIDRCSIGKCAGLALLSALFGSGAVDADLIAEGPARPKIVLVLYPDSNDGRPGSVLVDRGIRSTFAKGSPERIEIHSEHLDVARSADADYQQHLAEFLRRKYVGRKIDLVIAGLAPALNFALTYRELAFPGVPVVFCAVDERELATRKLPSGVIGVPIKMDLTATLDVALQLHPNTQRVYVITGKSKFDAHWQTEAARAFQAYTDKLEFVYLTGLPMPDLLKQVGALPDNSILYYVHVFEDGDGNVFVPAEALRLIAAKTNVPIYGHVDTYVGRGIVGGHVISFEAAGQEAAALGLRLIAGENADQIAVKGTSANSYLFDWRELRRWGISEASLPPGSIIRHHEPTFWDLYHWHILGVALLCVVEALLIFGLLVQRSSRKRAEKRFQQAVEAAPTGMLMVGQDGRIVLVNAHLEELFGYRKEEMLGQPVEMLLPDRFRGQHPDHRKVFLAAPEARPMGSGRELFGRRKDGSEIPVEIGLSPVRTRSGPVVLASVIDISERKRAEAGLRKNQAELRELTGRLLLAQETERRHIARELHDDLNQSLALLAVQLDLLSHKPPESLAQDGERIQELSGQVKQLSSKVHGLSHQLHPAKLEQLGLVAAVGSLCTDFAKSHGRAIAFEHEGIPAKLAHDTALCLYRIVQESLQNVIKHSDAQRAVVALSGDADTVCLKILDDGKGFDAKFADGKGGLGLVSIRERLHLVDGQITIDSKAGAGTRIVVRVPASSPTPNLELSLKPAATAVV